MHRALFLVVSKFIFRLIRPEQSSKSIVQRESLKLYSYHNVFCFNPKTPVNIIGIPILHNQNAIAACTARCQRA